MPSLGLSKRIQKLQSLYAVLDASGVAAALGLPE
jgi:hypothetical protein